MYRVPSEFIRQKNVLFGPITAAHAVGAFGGYLLAHALGGSAWAIVVCVALGLAVTTFHVQGLTLYLFVPLAVAYLVRRVKGDRIEPAEQPAAPSGMRLVLRDEDGKPLVFRED